MANGSRSSGMLALSPLRPPHIQSHTRGKTNVDGAPGWRSDSGRTWAYAAMG